MVLMLSPVEVAAGLKEKNKNYFAPSNEVQFSLSF